MSARDADLDRVLRRSGATYRQLDYWCRRGYLNPGNPGTGRPREWTTAEIGVAETMVRLVKAGLRPDVAAQVARTGNLEIAPGITVVVTTPRSPATDRTQREDV